jgi:hypothetical protein
MALLVGVDFFADRPDQPKLCGCGCGKPLDPRVDGERPQVGGKEVTEDCYYAAFGDEIDNFPIGGRGIRRR